MKKQVGKSVAVSSFSEEVAYVYAERSSEMACEPAHLVSVANMREAVKNGSVERRILPIENSNGGIVIEVVYAMAKYAFTIEHFFEIEVQHCILGSRVVCVSEITTITSHDQVLEQCNPCPKHCFPEVGFCEYSYTAQSYSDLGKGILAKMTVDMAPQA